MAIIHVTKNLRIHGTERAWQVERSKVSKGKFRWEPFLWFSSLQSAIRELTEREIRCSQCEGISEVIEHAKTVAEHYAKRAAAIAGDTRGFAAGREYDGKSSTDLSSATQSPARVSLVGRS